MRVLPEKVNYLKKIAGTEKHQAQLQFTSFARYGSSSCEVDRMYSHGYL
ncbi:MAG TPA: hypothetical protein VFI33_07300 [Puia sp.]|nr:hypothetical protein [Puia sp.]